MQYGLIGEKLGHSFSKEIHEKIEDYTYTLKEIAKGELESFITKKEFNAINVTIPYKEEVIPYLDVISDRAKAIGAVNTVVNKDGALYGYNTDGLGLIALLEKNDISLKGKKVIILGTGGTSKTALQVAKELGAKDVIRVGRSKKEGCITYEEMYLAHTDADIIINTTPCGMYPDCTSIPLKLERFSSLSGVCDVIYNPLRTPLVLQAKGLGINACGGLCMLVSQAVYAVEKFTKRPYDKDLADKIYSDILSSKENIVLTGMPSCGKSAIGEALSKLTSRVLIDTDKMIQEKHKMTIPEIFSKHGEKTFREWESECVAEASKTNGCIIATGGGAILRSENVSALKQNGRVYFIDRALENLSPTSDRPLALDKEAIAKRYDERYPIYTSVADETVSNNSTIDDVCKQILSLHFGR